MPGHVDGEGAPRVTSTAPSLSIVVPMLDAGDRVEALHAELADLLTRSFPDGELILVDDESTDATWRRITALAATDERVVGLRLASNVGQTGALCAGFSVARGAVVVMMDDDLECDTSDVERFVTAVRSGADFASGWRRGWRVPLRSIGSQVYNARLRSWGLPFHDAGCGFNAMSLDIAQRIAELGWEVRQHRFKPAVTTLTDRIVEVPFDVRPTTESHHGIRSLALSWLDVEFRHGPLTPARVVLAGVAAPTLAATWELAPRRWQRRSSPRRVLGLALVATTTVVGAASIGTLLEWRAAERANRRRAPFVIAERTPTTAS